LFSRNTLVQNFSYSLANCNGFSFIPTYLFTYNVNATNFSGLFYRCYNISNLPITLFDTCDKVTTFASAFEGYSTGAAYNKITTDAPDLWNRSPVPTGTSCFKNRTLMSNYASIPAGWK
jgi:hypothetical protein